MLKQCDEIFKWMTAALLSCDRRSGLDVPMFADISTGADFINVTWTLRDESSDVEGTLYSLKYRKTGLLPISPLLQLRGRLCISNIFLSIIQKPVMEH